MTSHLAPEIKKTTKYTYANAPIKAYIPTQPWAAATALTHVANEPFSSVETMDSEIDSFQDYLENPFCYFEENNSKETITATVLTTTKTDHLGNLATAEKKTPLPFPVRIGNTLESINKLFFTSFCIAPSSRRE